MWDGHHLFFLCVSLLLQQSYTKFTSRCISTCQGTCNEELGRCDCPKHMGGADCTKLLSPQALEQRCAAMLYSSIEDCLDSDASCLNACNGRGTCLSGFCLCHKGHYGADCSLSLHPDTNKPQILSGTGWTTRSRRPWVYVYELPPNLTSWVNTVRLDRPTPHLFWQRLLSSGARTADPEQADWFFIPIRQRGLNDKPLLGQAQEYIRATWPYWDRYQGHRHFLFALGDVGVQECNPKMVAKASNVTWLSYWGLYKNHNMAGWKAAHRPGKDIVLPVMTAAGHYRHFGLTNSPLHPQYNHLDITRNQTFFFAGRVCGDRQPPSTRRPPPHNCRSTYEEYSAGVRQAVHYYHWNRTGYNVLLSEKRYDLALQLHNFCLAPLGGGHGQRQVIVSFMGCIPVTIGDNVHQPFEPELPWSRFSVPVREKDVPRLHEILADISPEQLARKQAALKCAAQHFAWSTIQGGFINETGKYDAFETTLEILRMRLQYPGVKPRHYWKLDADFRRFMSCGADDLGMDPPPDTSSPLCTHSVLEGHLPPSCYHCMRGISRVHGVPGGVICCGKSRNLAQCPRLWH